MMGWGPVQPFTSPQAVGTPTRRPAGALRWVWGRGMVECGDGEGCEGWLQDVCTLDTAAAGRPKLTVEAQVTELVQCWTLLRVLVAEFSDWGVFVLRIVVDV